MTPAPQIVACVALLVLASASTKADDSTRATYLANEGVMLTRGDTSVLFDPLFDNGFGRYRLLPAAMQAALFAGTAPFEDVEAVFVSHAHGDHFAADLMLAYLRAQPSVKLYAPMQAVLAMRQAANDADGVLFDRVTGLDLEVGDDGVRLQLEGIDIDAVRIPHSGWPDRMTDIENIAFRVTLGDEVSVVHLGDAVVSDKHFGAQREFWEQRDTTLALPPYWFFLSAEGRDILSSDLDAGRSIGIHVPDNIPRESGDRPEELRDVDLFTEPGEQRTLNP